MRLAMEVAAMASVWRPRAEYEAERQSNREKNNEPFRRRQITVNPTSRRQSMHMLTRLNLNSRQEVSQRADTAAAENYQEDYVRIQANAGIPGIRLSSSRDQAARSIRV